MEISGQIVVYSITGCPHCMRAKNTLQQLNLPYSDVNLDTYPHVRDEVKARTGSRTVPQIFFNNIHIGGNDDLQKKVEDEAEWRRLVEEVRTKPAGADAPVVPDPSSAVEAVGSGGFHCEPDEYAKLVLDLKASGIIKDQRSGLWSYPQSFSGKDFVHWVTTSKGLDREKAMEMGAMLIDSHFSHGAQGDRSREFRDDGTLYRLLEDDVSNALNHGETSQCQPRPADELGEDIRRVILKIYGAFLSPDGKGVDYKGIAGSQEFKDGYMTLIKQLVRVSIEEESRETKLAFFINIYNALVIHANIVRGPPQNLWQRYKFFNTVNYIIGGHQYSLQDIENGVLRGNRKGVGQFSNPFGKKDPRAKGIMDQLRTAAEAFLENDESIKVNMQRSSVELSMIFKWYRVDFGHSDHEVLTTIQGYMGEGEKKQQLKELLDSKKFKVSYQKYDWSVNSK